MKIWVLTRAINDYNQDGDYYVTAWPSKPTHQQLNGAGVPYKNMNHVEAGGGPAGIEEEWYYLAQEDIGEPT